MRIFDPKNQFGSSLLSSADTQKSSVKLEKQMAVGGGAITLTSTDVSDIENWELSNASVEVEGRMISFLPDTVRGNDGSLTVDFGTYFPNAVLILKRTVFDGMKQEEEEITIEVEIQRLMEKTLATAGKDGYVASKNIAEWQDLGHRAKATGEDKYRAAEITVWNNDNSPFKLGPVVEESFLSLQSTSLNAFSWGSGITEWSSDLPCLQNADNSPFANGPIQVFDAKLPNLVDGTMMFWECVHLTTFKSEMPSLVKAGGNRKGDYGGDDPLGMFNNCTSLTSFQSDMPAGLTTNAQWMFCNCKLDITSVERISRTIAVCSGTDSDPESKVIHLGVSCVSDPNFQTYIGRMTGKGWTVLVNRYEL